MQDGMLVYWEFLSICLNSDSKSYKVEKIFNYIFKND